MAFLQPMAPTVIPRASRPLFQTPDIDWPGRICQALSLDVAAAP
jgi:hypothetical protein